MGVSKVDYNGETLIDLSNDSINPDVVLEGYTGHDSNGEPFEGRMVPSEGDAVQEIYYADFTVDFQNYAITDAKTNYQTIVDNIDAGKFIVGRGTYAFISSPENIGYFPLTAYVKEQNMLIFSGFAQAMSGSTLVLLSLTIEVPKNKTPTVRARLVSTTDLH